MTNKQKIESNLNGYTLGCYDKGMEALTASQINKVIQSITEESTDLKIGKYIVTIDTVDNEKDFSIMTVAQYENQFGKFENR